MRLSSAARQRLLANARGDISKHRHEVLIAAPGKTRRRRLTIANTTGDFMRLIAILREYGPPVRIGFEATGNYHRVLMFHLGVAGFDLKLVSSVALARRRVALHNRWDKNDPKDAQVILHMLQIGAVQIFQGPMVAGTNDIQELSKTHDVVSRIKTKLWHLSLPCIRCGRDHIMPAEPASATTQNVTGRSDATDEDQKIAGALISCGAAPRSPARRSPYALTAIEGNHLPGNRRVNRRGPTLHRAGRLG